MFTGFEKKKNNNNFPLFVSQFLFAQSPTEIPMESMHDVMSILPIR